MTEIKKNYEEDPRFANWNNFYNSLFKEMDITFNIIYICRTNLKDKTTTARNLEVFHAKLVSYSNIYADYIENNDENVQKLNKLFEMMHNKEYIAGLENKNKPLFKYQYYILTQMEEMMRNITKSFSAKGITPKIIKTNHKDPSKAISSGYN
jgi:hypothetical protein